ncbi:MAG: signal recognition particle receptor subunit alpha [Myxococcota bacterium]
MDQSVVFQVQNRHDESNFVCLQKRTTHGEIGMLETLSEGFLKARNALRGQTKLTQDNVKSALQQIRFSLLEADVEYKVMERFLRRVQEKTLGKVVRTSITDHKGQKHRLNPAEYFVGVCSDELEALMGADNVKLSLPPQLASIMMVGLQGAGKTTSTVKLAQHLQQQGRRPLLVAADTSRPAAVEQLQILAQKVQLSVHTAAGQTPLQLCQEGLQKAKQQGYDLVLFDTAGRLVVNESLMQELEQIKRTTKPFASLLVLDAMIGQEAVHTAQEFDQRLNLNGFILTKLDGDARGGAALSVREVTGKPIRFVGTGESIDAFEEFRPQGLASRILGMGDVVSLSKDFAKHVNEQEAQQDAQRMLKGQMNLQDLLKQLRIIRNMGPLRGILERLPGVQELFAGGASLQENALGSMESIILSMTPQERLQPHVVCEQQSRLRRIARGCGHAEKEVLSLLKRFNDMQKTMHVMGRGSLPGFARRAVPSSLESSSLDFLDGQQGLPNLPIAAPHDSKGAQHPDRQEKKRKRKLKQLGRKKNRKKRR